MEISLLTRSTEANMNDLKKRCAIYQTAGEKMHLIRSNLKLSNFQ